MCITGWGSNVRKFLLALCATLALTASGYAQGVGVTTPGWVHQYKLGADFTDANASGAQNIPALTFYLPAGIAQTYHIDCDINFSQATAAADSFNVQFSTAPTAVAIGGIAATNATAFAAGTPNATVDTATHVVVAFTPAVATVLYAHIGGYVEVASGAADVLVNIQVVQGTAANVIVIKRDSGCTVNAKP